jgi:hypothetical protein
MIALQSLTHAVTARCQSLTDLRLVLSVIRFDHSGKNKTIAWADGSSYPVNRPFDQPFSFFIAELFKIVDGKINRIEALVTAVPYGMYTGWPLRSTDEMI